MKKIFCVTILMFFPLFSGCFRVEAERKQPTITENQEPMPIPEPPEPEKSELEIAIDLIQKNKFEEAKTALQKIVKSEPKGPVALLLQAFVEFEKNEGADPIYLKTLIARELNQMQKPSLAIPLLHSVIAKQKNYRDAWILLGFSHLALQNIDQAIAGLEIAKKLDPSKPETLYLLGSAYLVARRYDDARAYLTTALQLEYEPKEQVQQKLAEIDNLQNASLPRTLK